MNGKNLNGKKIGKMQGWLALSPIVVFLLLYVAVSVIAGDFYKMPIAVALLAASIWGVIISRGKPLIKRIEIFTEGAAHRDVLYMICIFIMAGAFAMLAKETGAVDATVNLTLLVFPPEYLVAGLFIAACFISLSIGTSVGTVVALTPLAVEIALTTGGDTAFYVASVLGGSFFGDNLSFISDTTITATRSQGCKMGDKFKANLWIALPAALITLGLYIVMGEGVTDTVTYSESNYWLVIPYLTIIILAICGVNVTLVLLCGIISAVILGFIFDFSFLSLAEFMGKGIDSMGNLVIITLLASGMLGLIKKAGGISFLLQVMTRKIHGSRGAQTCIAFLVGLVNLCTANNTIAIITVGSISKDIAGKYGVDPRKSASILDTCSCIVQCLIPYGAQTLLATSLAGISPVAPFRYLYYPWILAAIVGLSIIFRFPAYLNRRYATA